jgi:hypothetical protein
VTISDEAIASRLSEVLCAAQRRARQSRSGFGVFTAPAIPERYIDEAARGMAPVMRLLAVAAAEEVVAGGCRDALDGKDTALASLLAQMVAEVAHPAEPKAAAWSKHLATVTERPRSVTTDLRPGAA